MFHSRGLACALSAVVGICASSASAQEYIFTLDETGSGTTGTAGATVDTNGTLIGDWDATTNPGGTRTKPTGSFLDFPGPSENLPVPTDVSLALDTTLATQTSGLFGLTLDAGSVSIDGLALDLLSGAPVSSAVGASVSFASFSTASPNFFYPAVPVDLALGDATIDSLQLTQTGAPAIGSATPTGAFTFDIAVQIPTLLSGSATFQGESIPFADVPFLLTLAGELTRDIGAATFTGGFDVVLDETMMVDIPLEAFPAELPTFGTATAGVVLSLNADALSFAIDAGVTIGADGVVVPAPGSVLVGVLGFCGLARRRRR
ncbi:MAG: hypothetical protein Tsb0013_04010 [Phycisphaerales bacterium]